MISRTQQPLRFVLDLDDLDLRAQGFVLGCFDDREELKDKPQEGESTNLRSRLQRRHRHMLHNGRAQCMDLNNYENHVEAYSSYTKQKHPSRLTALPAPPPPPPPPPEPTLLAVLSISR